MLRVKNLRQQHPIRTLLALAMLSAVVCLSPASALAQSAGDEQYRDPLAGENGGGGNSGGNSGNSGNNGSNSGSGTANPSQGTTQPQEQTQTDTPQSTTTTPTPDATAGTASGSTSGATLPRTGFDYSLVMLGMGVAMLAGGAMLRWRLSAQRPRTAYLFTR